MEPDQTKDTAFDLVPAPALVLLAILSIQLGAALAIDLFATLGPSGAVASRLALSAILLLALFRPRLNAEVFRHYKLLLCYGVTLSLMNWCFYEAIARIPLGLAVTIEFMGPLMVAVFSSQRRIDYLWVAIAISGLMFLTPEIGDNIDPIGVAYAVAAGIGWGGFVLLSKRVSAALPGNTGLICGMIIASFCILPIAGGNVLPIFGDISLFGMVLLLAILSTAVPFLFEFSALKKLSAHTYGILITLEPAVAALIGAVLLGDALGLKGVVAVACVTVAAIGATLTSKEGAKGKS